MVYERFVKQLDGCTYHTGGDNCSCAAEAMWLYRASQGAIKLTACQVRRETGDKVNGTRLEQMEKVSIAHGIAGGKLYKPTTTKQIKSLIQTGRYGCHWQGDYSPIAGTEWDCFDGNFRDGHDFYISTGTSSIAHYGDPGADGRRPSIPKGFQDIPWSYLEKAAGMLILDSSGETMNHRYGPGHVFAYVTPADPIVPTAKYRVAINGTAPNPDVATSLYNVPNGIRVGGVTKATYICTRSKVGGLWWFQIKSGTVGPTANAGRWFKPNRYTTISPI